MTKKSLQQWYNDGHFTYDQKSIINKFGVNDYYPEYASRDLKKLWYLDEILERKKASGELWIYGKIQKMIFFSADWNNNLVIVIAGNTHYRVYLLVYEMPSRQMGEILEKFEMLVDYGSLNIATQRAYELETTLKSYNPVTYLWLPKLEIIYENYYNSSNYPSIFKNGQVKRIELPYYSAKENPDDYIKPLDIVKRLNERMVHTCIYLGNKKIAHAYGGNSLEIESWDEFFDNVNVGNTNKMLRYHPIIAFKTPERIIEHIAKCVEGKSSYYSKDFKDRFNVVGTAEKPANNCESFANRCVLGLNFSELGDRHFGSSSKSFIVPTVYLEENNAVLSRLPSCSSYTINKIRDYKNSVHHPQGIKMEARIEVEPKPWCELRR